MIGPPRMPLGMAWALSVCSEDSPCSTPFPPVQTAQPITDCYRARLPSQPAVLASPLGWRRQCRRRDAVKGSLMDYYASPTTRGRGGLPRPPAARYRGFLPLTSPLPPSPSQEKIDRA